MMFSFVQQDPRRVTRKFNFWLTEEFPGLLKSSKFSMRISPIAIDELGDYIHTYERLIIEVFTRKDVRYVAVMITEVKILSRRSMSYSVAFNEIFPSFFLKYKH
jgi:hypothetical protein